MSMGGGCRTAQRRDGTAPDRNATTPRRTGTRPPTETAHLKIGTDRSDYPNHSNPKGHTMSNHTTTEDHAPAHGMPRPRLATQPTTLEIVRNIENGNRAQAAEQITEHPEPARMAIAVLTTLADHTGFNSTAEDWRDAVATVVRTLNAAR